MLGFQLLEISKPGDQHIDAQEMVQFSIWQPCCQNLATLFVGGVPNCYQSIPRPIEHGDMKFELYIMFILQLMVKIRQSSNPVVQNLATLFAWKHF